MLEKQLLIAMPLLAADHSKPAPSAGFSQIGAEAVCRLRQQTKPHLSRRSLGDVEGPCHL